MCEYKVSIGIDEKEVNFLIRDYQNLLILQEMSDWKMFNVLINKMEDFFPLGQWIKEANGNQYLNFMQWARKASFGELKKALFSKSWGR